MSLNTSSKEDLMQEQILKAAKALFSRYGLAKVTMDDVAKAIGKGRSSLYYYYKSKDEIVEAVINIRIKEIRTLIEKAVNESTTAESKINAFFATKLKLIRENSSFFDALESGMDADAISNFNKTKITYHNLTLKWEGNLLHKILNEGIEKTELKAIGKNEMDTLIFILLSTLHGLKREIRMENNVREIEPAVNQFTKMIMHGL